MAIAALFRSSGKDLVENLQKNLFKTPEEKKQALEDLAASTSVKTADAVGLLFATDGETRKAAGKLLAARRDPDTVRRFVLATKGRPEAARRAALAVLATLPVGSIPQQMAALLEHSDAAVKKLAAEAILDLPLTAETVPLLVRIVESGEAGQRLKAVTRFAAVAVAPRRRASATGVGRMCSTRAVNRRPRRRCSAATFNHRRSPFWARLPVVGRRHGGDEL